MVVRDRIAVVARDGRKADLIARATCNRARISEFEKNPGGSLLGEHPDEAET